MTRILRNTFTASMLVAAAMTLAGCPTGLGAAIPGTGGTVGGGTTPGTTVGGGGTVSTGPAACARTSPSGSPDTGEASMGGYSGQLLPDGWNAAYNTEAEVTAAIRKIAATPDWNCFQKFYNGATIVYAGK